MFSFFTYYHMVCTRQTPRLFRDTSYHGVVFQLVPFVLVFFFHLHKNTTHTNEAGRQRHTHTHASKCFAHLIVERTEVLEMAKAGVAETDEDGDGQHHQGEQRRGSPEP